MPAADVHGPGVVAAGTTPAPRDGGAASAAA